MTLFQVALASSTYHPAVAWLGCLQPFTIPVGESSYSVTVEASYSQCQATANLERARSSARGARLAGSVSTVALFLRQGCVSGAHAASPCA